MKSVRSLLHIGSHGALIEAECHLSNGLPTMVIVGLGNKAVDEAKERVRSAFMSTHLPFPRKRITVNLAPADVPKDATSLDLAIAASILQASEQTKVFLAPTQAVIGELGLDGAVRPVRGIIGKLLAGKRLGLDTFFVPEGNLRQALLVPDITVIPVTSIKRLYDGLNGIAPLEEHRSGAGAKLPTNTAAGADDHPFHHIIGQHRAKRAAEIAAAGGHNIFLSGPPGTGKSMIAKALPSILPPLTREEILEITHLHSLASNDYDQLVTTRPFRAPHHSSSYAAIVGGGHRLKPGEISLSHRGVLLLDEMPEFSRASLEALRQPLEDGEIVISRAKDSSRYPARFILVGTANPCPCGYFGSTRPCECTASQILRYRQKISGPIMDRIDLYVTVEKIKHAQLLNASPDNDAADKQIRARVNRARAIQAARQTAAVLNAHLNNRQITRHAALTPDAKEILSRAGERLNLSARSFMRTLKVARTIADLADSPQTEVPHITEALQYRNQTRLP